MSEGLVSPVQLMTNPKRRARSKVPPQGPWNNGGRLEVTTFLGKIEDARGAEGPVRRHRVDEKVVLRSYVCRHMVTFQRVAQRTGGSVVACFPSQSRCSCRGRQRLPKSDICAAWAWMALHRSPPQRIAGSSGVWPPLAVKPVNQDMQKCKHGPWIS